MHALDMAEPGVSTLIGLGSPRLRPDTAHNDNGINVNTRMSSHHDFHNNTKRLPSKPLGKPRAKRLFEISDHTALSIVWLCLVAGIVTVTPQELAVPWKLGYKRQLQIIGFLLSIMNQCLRAVSPKLLLILEARFGESTLQNYDAILRNSATMSQTHYLWRCVLLAFVALPIGLSVAYKDFQQGYGTRHSSNSGNFYGMTGPAGVRLSGSSEGVGISYMVNATLPYILASGDDSLPPPKISRPRPYGFNMLLLSDTSTAFLDGPMPDYVTSLQQRLEEGETYQLTARVHATVTTYNDSVESHRNDSQFWQYYCDEVYGQHRRNGQNTTNELHSLISSSPMYNGYNLALFTRPQAGDESWFFLSYYPSSLSKSSQNLTTAFQANALQFSTRRELCDGTWTISYNSMLLTNGSCTHAPLPSSDQDLFTNNTFAFSQFYIPTLIEYLGPFSRERATSPWLLPTTTSVVAAMYWSRATAIHGYYSWATNPDPTAYQRPELYYQLNDTIMSTRPTMSTSGTLYLVLALQPILTTLIVVASLFVYRTPVDGGFGLVALLAGVRIDTLMLLQGASFSGILDKPLPVKILVDEEPAATRGKAVLQAEYVLGAPSSPRATVVGGKHKGGWMRGNDNELLSHSIRHRMPWRKKGSSLGSRRSTTENRWRHSRKDSGKFIKPKGYGSSASATAFGGGLGFGGGGRGFGRVSLGLGKGRLPSFDML